MPLSAVRIFTLTKRTGRLLLLGNRKNVLKGCESIRPIVPIEREIGKRKSLASARTLCNFCTNVP